MATTYLSPVKLWARLAKSWASSWVDFCPDMEKEANPRRVD